MNKRYIKTVFIILSLVAYASNKAHASEADSETENLNSVSTENLATNENQENGELVESHDPEAPQDEQGEENYAYEETQGEQGEENYAYEETQVGQGEENYGSSETLNYQGEENYAPEETQAEEIVENNAPEETHAEVIVENNAPEETQAEEIVENNAPEETQAEEIVENNPPKETKKEELVEYSEADVNERAHEIMSKVLDRVRRYSDIYNTQNCFYFPNPTRYVCFTVDENVEIARFHLVIQDLNKYDAIVNFLRGIDDIYHFGRKDDKAIIIGKYGPNLQMLQRYKKTAENRPNIYSFGLFTTVDDSEDMSIIAKTWADIYDVKHVYKKNGEKSGKTTKRFHTAHDLAKASEDVVMHNMFTDLSAFVVKRHEDNIGVTYVEYNPRFKYDPDNYKSTDDRANSMMALMDRMYAILNQ